MKPLLGLPLRVRLTLAFASASAILLAGAGAYIFLEVKAGLDASLDASLRSTAAQYARLSGRPSLVPLKRALAVEGQPAQLLAADGTVMSASPRAQGRPLLGGARLRSAARTEVLFERREAVRLLGRPAPGGRVFVISTSMVQRERALEELGRVLVIGGPLILLLSSGAGYLVASGALRAVERMRRRAAQISAISPDARLPLPRTRDELRRLGTTLNEMLSRLAESAAHERAFLATASHELRTPLAILKTEVELALHEEATEAELRDALTSVGQEADRLIRLAEDLLVIAGDQQRGLPLDPQAVRLDELAESVTQRFALLTDGEVRSRVPPELVLRADHVRLEQALSNLIDNALRHGAPPIEVSADRDGDVVEVHVADAGRGDTASRVPHAFEKGEPHLADGSGLGLMIVATIARAHGGSVGAASRRGGTDVWLRLPVSGPPAAA